MEKDLWGPLASAKSATRPNGFTRSDRVSLDFALPVGFPAQCRRNVLRERLQDMNTKSNTQLRGDREHEGVRAHDGRVVPQILDELVRLTHVRATEGGAESVDDAHLVRSLTLAQLMKLLVLRRHHGEHAAADGDARGVRVSGAR